MKFPACKHVRGGSVRHRTVKCGLYGQQSPNASGQVPGQWPRVDVCMKTCADYDGPERTEKRIKAVWPQDVTLTHARTPVKRKLTLADIRKYLRAELSLFTQGPVSLPIYEQRVKQCIHKATDPDDGREYCKGCGCGARSRAKFDVKMHMPAFACNKCGIEPAKGEGRRALNRIGGARRQARLAIRAMLKEHGFTFRDLLRKDTP